MRAEWMAEWMIVAVLLALLAWPAGLCAEPKSLAPPGDVDNNDDATHPVRISGYWDNDGGPIAAFNNTDRHYTNGVGFGATHQPGWADRLARFMPFHDAFDPNETGMGYILAQLMFTPSDLKQSQVILDDRPYAGYLYGGAYFQRANDDALEHFQLDLGAIGESSQADDVQRGIHKLISGVTPEGWDNQLHDEFTVQFTYRRTWKLDAIEWLAPGVDRPPHGFGVEILPELGARLGTVWRDFEVGSTLRFGFNLPGNFGPARLLRPADAVAVAPDDFSIYAFGRAAARFVQHNTLLEGNNFRDSHHVDPVPVVGELTAGAALSYNKNPWTAELAYSYTIRTDEFQSQRQTHAFASLHLALTCWFN